MSALAIAAVPCPRCGRPWLPCALSTLPCHARCLFSPELQDDIYHLKLRFPQVSQQRLLRDFGVPLRVIRIALFEGARRAGKVVTRWGR